jgi:hypothetical protein
MTKNINWVLVILVFFALCLFNAIALETYEDHMQKIGFSNFYQKANYYKLNFSFWPEMFFAVYKWNSAIPWYELFLCAINIITLSLCLTKLKGNTNRIIFFLAVLIPQLVLINYTRTTIFTSAVATIGILESRKKIHIGLYVTLLLIAASIRWQMSVYAIVITTILYLKLVNIKKVVWLLPIVTIPIYMHIQNTSPSQINFFKTEPYIFTLNDANIHKDIPVNDHNILLVKNMAIRWIFPERTHINEESLSKITYSSFWSSEALSLFYKSTIYKMKKYHNTSLLYLLIGYSFLLFPFALSYFLKIHTIKYEFLFRVGLSLLLLVLVCVLVKIELRLLYPSLMIVLLFIMHTNMCFESPQKRILLLFSLSMMLFHLFYVTAVKKKTLLNQTIVKELHNSINNASNNGSCIVWDAQSITANFQPAFKTISTNYQNYFIEEPYINVLSQVPNKYFLNFDDFFGYISQKSIFVVDKERFNFINQYLLTFYGKQYQFHTIEETSYPSKFKVNQVPDNPYASDTSFLIVRFNRNTQQ